MPVIIDVKSCSPSTYNWWEKSGLLSKLVILDPVIIILDPDLRDWASNAEVYDSLDKIEVKFTDICIRVDAQQLFLDFDIVKAGIDRFSSFEGDYFTQWEHCRLPVGIGIRAYKGRLLKLSDCQSFKDLDSYIFDNRKKINVMYDENIYTSFEDSSLDSRVEILVDSGDWNLAGFLKHADLGNKIKYKSQTKAQCIDERGIPAAYGFETEKCGDFPTYVMFDMTNKCNAKCIHCPHSIGFPGSEDPKFINEKNFRRVIDQCVGKEISFVRVTADGEPLLHPEIWDLLNYARDKGVGPVGLTSNGSALNETNAQKLLDSKIFMVDFSLDAFSAATFELVRTGLSYERTRKNVSRLLAMRDKTGSNLKIVVSFVKQDENAHELNDFVDYWEPLVDKVLIREMHTNVGVNDNKDDEATFGQDRYPCPHLFRRTIADYAGDWKFCPIDWHGGSKIAQIKDINMRDVWHNEIYHNHRLQHLNNKFDKDSICATCIDWKSTPWDLGYEKIISDLSSDQDRTEGGQK